ncbi:HAMP domain-containing histidine kinase [Cryobacterium algoricola]|uniref:histidine kinase n=1 Tax=Cryobacterium algoricola TaxID=1259183 RepID=A0ABY2IE08_9MICO|nr:HAMP domain-containing sensor histidine kinase [Cryobacterium algoricola]TFB86849.1 HAMP domain-containing histidine kinase [Cryobacterium algoricola]
MRTEARRTRVTLRMRLTITYTLLILLTGFSVLVAVAIVLAIIPGYYFTQGQYPSGVMGTPSINVQDKSDLLRLLAFVAVPILTVVGGLGAAVSWFTTGRALRPLTDIAHTAQTLDGRSLGTRIALEGPKDEVHVLADTIDGMLERLEVSFATQARFGANVSHELRTPLATTKTLLQVADKRPQSAENRKLLQRLMITNDRTIDITHALLNLAGSSRLDGPHTVDLAGIVREELDEQTTSLVAAGLRVTSSVDDALVAGEPMLLQLLARNLIQNAIRHNRDNGFVNVLVQKRTEGTYLRVANSGSVIDAATIPLLAEAFFRSDLRTASGADTGGHGLGLALVKSIVEAHGARLVLVSGIPDGLVVEVWFPVLTSDIGMPVGQHPLSHEQI